MQNTHSAVFANFGEVLMFPDIARCCNLNVFVGDGRNIEASRTCRNEENSTMNLSFGGMVLLAIGYRVF